MRFVVISCFDCGKNKDLRSYDSRQTNQTISSKEHQRSKYCLLTFNH